ncbi:putative carboxylesterase 12 [Acorus calamus]|uniref:Carboxylesterase 12 n=1 Tax=Acorus calamus TaxID=4465 RepID=A0AAV9CSX5_ACOCL|nr:putative carboxylesterase 12 [Acorus calamus]
MQVKHDFFPFIRVYADGHVERFKGTDVVPPSIDPLSPVSSKDILINLSTSLSLRLYLPNHHPNKLPLLIYFHGGGFCTESAASPTYHNHLTTLSSDAHIAIASVDYRRAPEHPLPVAYDDSWEVLQWIASQAQAREREPWLRDHVDLARVFLGGDSAGGNICHNVAMRVGAEGGLSASRIEGMVLVHPYFWASEGADALAEEERARHETIWKLICPTLAGFDDPRVNPFGLGAPSLAGLGCARVMVCVAEKDFMCEWGRRYGEGLKRSGWMGEVEVVESEGEGHVFHLIDPGCDSSKVLMKRLVGFFNHSSL